MSTDYYSTLGCNKQSSQDDIKKAYKKLALLHHPDKNNGNDDMFKKINEAYSVLSDSEKKSNYDRFGSANAPQMQNPFSHFESFFSQGGFSFGGGPSFSFHSNMHQPSVNRKIETLTITVDITLEDVFHGFSILHTFDQPVGCDCVSPCNQCRGQGILNVIRDLGIVRQATQVICPTCNRTGIQKHSDCKTCNGSGKNMSKKQIRVNGPKGLNNGHSLTLRNGGEQPSKHITGVQPGDLLITIRVKEHSIFTRQDNHLIYTHEMDWIDSICGKEISIPLFDEPFPLDTTDFGILYPDKKYTVSNKGLFDVNGGRGELHVYFKIKQPNIPQEKLKQLREAITNCLEN